MAWDDEAEYRKRRPDPGDRPEDEVVGGWHAEGLPEEFYFVWHVLREPDGRYRVVIDWFLPWDAVDWGWDYAWRSKDQAVLWAKSAVRSLAEVERDFVQDHGIDPAVIETMELFMQENTYDDPDLRPGPDDRNPIRSMNGRRRRNRK